jgi:hypothetical protein
MQEHEFEIAIVISNARNSSFPWSWSLGAMPMKCQHGPATPSFFAVWFPLFHPTRSRSNMRQIPSPSGPGMGACSRSITMERYSPLAPSEDHVYQQASPLSKTPSSSPLARMRTLPEIHRIRIVVDSVQ